MSISDPQLYVKAYDLGLDLLKRCDRLPRPERRVLGERLREDVLTLLTEVSQAVSFPEQRLVHLQNVDRSLVRLRLLTRLLGDRKVWQAHQRRFVIEKLDELGRMVGGWQKQLKQLRGTSTT